MTSKELKQLNDLWLNKCNKKSCPILDYLFTEEKTIQLKNIPEWLKETLKKENLEKQLRDIIGRYSPNPDSTRGEYDMDNIIGFMQPFLMGLADQAREFYEKKFGEAIKDIDNTLDWYAKRGGLLPYDWHDYFVPKWKKLKRLVKK